MTIKSIDTLLQDIFDLFDTGHEVSDDRCNQLGMTLAATIKNRLESYKEERKPFLRLSSIGKPDRQLYYEMNSYPKRELQPQTKMMFLYGDIIEDYHLFLAEEAGHKVEEQQSEVEIEGVLGHKDARIDGVTVDVKSASPYSFKKFQDATLFDSDPFGYVAQLSAYIQADETKGKPEEGYFWAVNKVTAEPVLLQLPPSQQIAARDRVKFVKEMVKYPDPPPRCYEPVPEGKSGNLKLAIGCVFCPFRDECWKDANEDKGIRSFKYSHGVTHLVEVKREPKVNEVME